MTNPDERALSERGRGRAHAGRGTLPVAAHTVISLDADEESLFGYITSLSTDKQPTFEIPADRLPAFRRKRQGKGGSDGQLELSFDEFD